MSRDIGHSRTHVEAPGHFLKIVAKQLTVAQAAQEGHFRLRYDRVGADHRGKRVIALIDETTVTVIHLDTGEIIATNTIEPNVSYWRNAQKVPGRWPGTSQK